MGAVVTRGESVYQCDICNRNIRVPANKQGLDIIQRCVITQGCQGKLHRVTATRDINSTPAFPPELQGVQDWVQRKVLHTHQQPIATATWVVHHDLANKPILHTYLNRNVNGAQALISAQPKAVRTVDLNTTELTFEGPESGLVQCVALSGKNVTNPGAAEVAAASTDAIQVSADSGELTLATLNTTPVITVTLTYITSGRPDPVIVEYLAVDSASIDSPWVSSQSVIANGKRYKTRSFNIVTTPLGPANFTQSNIIDGSTFFVSHINGVAVGPNDALILLGKAPYASVDRITDKFIDLFAIDKVAPQLFYSQGRAHALPAVIKSTYPHILAF